MKSCLYPYYEGADFRSDICFEKFWAQTSKFRLFGPKSINFLILTKFCLYRVSNLQILAICVKKKKKKINFLTKLHLPLFDSSDSNYTFEQKSQNAGIMGQDQSAHLG